MTDIHRRERQAKLLRIFRKLHRTTGALLFIFFFVVSLTGLLLGWKKHSGGTLLANSYKGSSMNPPDWLSIDSLHSLASQYLHDSVSPRLSLVLDRIDIRPEKGMVKFVFRDHFKGLQLDLTTGRLLHIENRRSDFIEKIHDGSILDFYTGIESGILKLLYTTIMGLALLLFTITGFWLWYGPKRMRKQ
jgi:uncharacterized iron-regulated membrane protein